MDFRCAIRAIKLPNSAILNRKPLLKFFNNLNTRDRDPYFYFHESLVSFSLSSFALALCAGLGCHDSNPPECPAMSPFSFMPQPGQMLSNLIVERRVVNLQL